MYKFRFYLLKKITNSHIYMHICVCAGTINIRNCYSFIRVFQLAIENSLCTVRASIVVTTIVINLWQLIHFHLMAKIKAIKRLYRRTNDN